jgi:hypothetical protein
MPDVNPKRRFRLQVWKPYYGAMRQWEYVVIDTFAYGPLRVISSRTSPDWSWDDAMNIGLRDRFLVEQEELGHARQPESRRRPGP